MCMPVYPFSVGDSFVQHLFAALYLQFVTTSTVKVTTIRPRNFTLVDLIDSL